jgi:energy-coupling factor transporter ATP-binding protein EcfA2
MVSKFQHIVNQIERNRRIKAEGGLTSIPPPFIRLSDTYGGFTKGSITCLTSNSGTGKTKLCKYLTVLNTYKQTFGTQIKPKVFYFALEESETDFWLSFISYFLYEKYKLTVSVVQLKSVGNFTISGDLMIKIREAEAFIQRLQEFVEVIDYVRNPTGCAKVIKTYFDNPEIGEYTYKETEDGRKIVTGYKYKNEDHWVFFVLDHISLLSNETSPDTKTRLTSYQTFDFMIKDYVLEVFSKRFNMVNVIVHQQTPTSEKQTYTSKGGLIEEKLEPSLEELHLNKGVQQDYRTVIGLFNPSRYDIPTHNGYDISLLGSSYRSLKFLKDRDFGLENSSVGLYFNGANGEFQELPTPQEMLTSNHYEKYRNLR